MSEEMVIRCVELQLGRKVKSMGDRFMEDLGAESIDMVHIVEAVESFSGVFVPEEVIPDLITVRDLVNYIYKDRK